MIGGAGGDRTDGEQQRTEDEHVSDYERAGSEVRETTRAAHRPPSAR
jgi:hypothetical protein